MKPVAWRLSAVLLSLVDLAVQAAQAADVTPSESRWSFPNWIGSWNKP
jgi:hypothetical protein